MNEQLHRASVPQPTPSAESVARNDDPARLERDIDHTRDRISRTVDALEQKLSPREFTDQAIEVLRNRGGEFGTNLLDQVQRNPLPAIVTAAGLLWLMSSSGSSSRYSSGWSSRGGQIRESVGDVAGRASEVASGLAEKGASVAQSVKESVSGLGSQIGRGAEQVRHAAARARDVSSGSSERFRSEFEHLLDEQPIVVAAIGVAIGAAIGALLPSTETEDRVMGSASDSVTGKLGSLSAEGLDIAREKAGEVADELSKAVGGASEAATGSTGNRDTGMPGAGPGPVHDVRELR